MLKKVGIIKITNAKLVYMNLTHLIAILKLISVLMNKGEPIFVLHFKNRIHNIIVLPAFPLMNCFKLSTIKQQPTLPAVSSSAPPPPLTLAIQSIRTLNYPVEALIQVIESHFEAEPCPALLVARALKVISVSLKDK
jgi:hypothetical protein